jgi:hypothetical protein
MHAWLHDPLVQSGALPFAAALVTAVALKPLRLAGLAAGAGFLVAVWLIGNFTLDPLTATRKLVLGGVAAIALGASLDLGGIRPGRTGRLMLGLAFGACAVWMLWTVLLQPPLAQALAFGAGGFALTAWLVSATLAAAVDPLRAGAAGAALGLGSGVAATLGGSALLGQYGIALGSACAGFLLVAVARGGRDEPGAGLALTAAGVAALVVSGAVALASLSWLVLPALALVPLAAQIPIPRGANAGLRATAALIYTGAAAALACAVAWWVRQGGVG